MEIKYRYGAYSIHYRLKNWYNTFKLKKRKSEQDGQYFSHHRRSTLHP